MADVTVSQDVFGQTDDGKDVLRFTFSNKNNVTVRVINYGCIITDILVPDKDGNVADISLGYDNFAGYKSNPNYFGAICGRFGSRIARGKFTLDGKEYTLALNDAFSVPPSHLHGGNKGFNKVLWDATLEGNKLHLTYISHDGEEGYPGELTTTLTYQLTNDNQFILYYTATTTKATPINLLNHAYINLGGQNSGDITDHVFTIHADSYTPFTENYLPTGQIASVEGSLYDMRHPTRLGPRLDIDNGFTINYCVGEAHKNKLIAKIEHPPSGRWMEVHSTEPSLQTYFSSQLKDCAGKGGYTYKPFSAFCMEAMAYPDAINHANFPDCVLRPEKTYHQITTYKFGVTS